MLLGVFLHAALPYIYINFPWAVVDPSRSASLTLVVFLVHAFRMPAFFLIAGFFARLLFQRVGSRGFARHRVKRILLPLVAAWIVLFPTVRALWVWSAIRAVPGSDGRSFWDALTSAFSLQFITHGLGFIHLWFLYYLLVLYVAFFAARAAWIRWADRDGSRCERLDIQFASLVRSRWCSVVLALPTAWVLLMMRGWGVDFVDRSLVPQVPHVLFYGSFFAFGWMMHRQPALLAPLRDRWAMHLLLGLAAMIPQSWMLYFIYVVNVPALPLTRAVFFFLYATMAWLLVLGLVGLFLRFFDVPRRLWRYLADSSYWLYLAHMPLVVALPILLREVRIAWYFKLPIVLVIAIPLLLVSYHLLVRSTWVGVILNGRRLPLRSKSPMEPLAP